MSELASRFGAHPKMIHKWKKAFGENHIMPAGNILKNNENSICRGNTLSAMNVAQLGMRALDNCDDRLEAAL